MELSKTKHTVKSVAMHFKANGCDLLETKYINTKTKMKYLCKCGNYAEKSFNDFKRSKNCKYCEKKQRGSTKKLTFDFVKSFIENENYTLVSNEYKRNDVKLSMICPNGHDYEATFQNFKAGYRCGKCAGNSSLSISEVASLFKIHDCELISTEYVNVFEKLTFRCQCSKLYAKSLVKFKEHPYCKACGILKRSDELRENIDSVRKYLSDFGYTLISKTYNNAREKVAIKCDNDHEFSMSIMSFKRGSRCLDCQGKHRYNLTEAIEIFHKRGFILLSNDYKDVVTPLDYICSCGLKSKISLSGVLHGQSCRKCGSKKAAEKRKMNIEILIEYFKDRDCELLTFKYKDKYTKLTFLCRCGEKSVTTWQIFRRGHTRCRKCFIKGVSGENNWNYKFDKTIEEREIERRFDGYSDWVKQVYERDDYTCQCCGIRGGKLNAHHLDSYDWCITGRIDVDNGVTLCKLCHTDFHGIYGYGDNTREQFDEFISDLNYEVII